MRGLVQVGEDGLDHRRVFDAGDHLQRSAAARTGFDVDVEYPLEALCPTPGAMRLASRWCLVGAQ